MTGGTVDSRIRGNDGKRQAEPDLSFLAERSGDQESRDSYFMDSRFRGNDRGKKRERYLSHHSGRSIAESRNPSPHSRGRAGRGFDTLPPMGKKKKGKSGRGSATIALNKKASHDYHIEQRFEAGLSLEGWEVKSLRAGRAQLKESYVRILQGEAFLLGCHISPLPSASSHIDPDPVRTRKLLLKRAEINRLIGLTERAGYTLVPTALYWKRGRAKLEIGLAKGKKLYDKRVTQKDRDWQREKARLFKKGH